MIQIVLDTNIILSSISRKSPYNLIIRQLFEDKYDLCYNRNSVGI